MNLMEGALCIASFQVFNVTYVGNDDDINASTQITARYTLNYMALVPTQPGFDKPPPIFCGRGTAVCGDDLSEIMAMAMAEGAKDRSAARNKGAAGVNNGSDDSEAANDSDGDDDDVDDDEEPINMAVKPPSKARQSADEGASGSKRKKTVAEKDFFDF
jgi:hypothetical protein